MKRLFAFIGALMALAACNNGFIDGPAAPVSDGQVMVNLTINRSDVFGASPDTKASVKDDWADGDVIFVFFKGVAAPKYLELKYNGGDWTSTLKNGLSEADLTGAEDKKMTAVYLPYGSGATVASDNGRFIFNNLTYYGVFLQTEQVRYSFESDELGGVLNMSAPAFEDGGKYVHFDISGYDDEHFYTLSQEYVTPLVFTGVSASGELDYIVGKKGSPMIGYVDATGSFMGFSGILSAAAVGEELDYQFSVNDETACVLYTRDAGNKTLSSSKYIGIGDISSTTTWKATEYVDLGIVDESGDNVLWAKKNLGATAEIGEGCFGNLYAYMRTDGHKMIYTIEDPERWFYNVYMEDGYEFSSENYEANTNIGDPATAELFGLWRLPSIKELRALLESCDNSVINNDGPIDEKGVYFYNAKDASKKIFMPRAVCYDYSHTRGWGFYWSGSENHAILNLSTLAIAGTYSYYAGRSVRPVFSMKLMKAATEGVVMPTSSTTGKINGYSYVDMGTGVKWATMNVGADSETDTGDYFAWGETEPKSTYLGANYKFLDVPDGVDLDEENAWLYFNKYTYPDGQGGYGVIWYNGDEFVGDGKTEFSEYGYEDDAARQNWGSTWRTPTVDEWNYLRTRSNYSWTDDYKGTGIAGFIFVSEVKGYEGNTLFLPAAGGYDADDLQDSNSFCIYWSSSIYTVDCNQALGIINNETDDDMTFRFAYFYRAYGLSVRAVSD